MLSYHFPNLCCNFLSRLTDTTQDSSLTGLIRSKFRNFVLGTCSVVRFHIGAIPWLVMIFLGFIVARGRLATRRTLGFCRSERPLVLVDAASEL